MKRYFKIFGVALVNAVVLLLGLFGGLVYGAYIGSDLSLDVDRDGTKDIHLKYDGTYMALLFGAVEDPTLTTARGIRYSTGDLEYNDAGTWTDVGSGGGGYGTAYTLIPLEMHEGIPQNNLDVVDPRLGYDETNEHAYSKRIALSGTNTSSDLFYSFLLPDDFDEFYQDGDNIFINIYSSDRANNTITMSVIDYAGDVDDGVNAADIEPSADSSWEEASDKITETDANYVAGTRVNVQVQVNLDSGDYYYIGGGYVKVKRQAL